MTVQFFKQPILNSPDDYLAQYCELDSNGQLTNRINDQASTIRNYWVPKVNNLSSFSLWALVAFTTLHEIETKFKELLAELISTPAHHY